MIESNLSKKNLKIKGYKSDASKFKEAELLANSVGEFGKIDILVNNAGITKDNLLMRMSKMIFISFKCKFKFGF